MDFYTAQILLYCSDELAMLCGCSSPKSYFSINVTVEAEIII